MLGFNASQLRKAALTSIDGYGDDEVKGTLVIEGGCEVDGVSIGMGTYATCDEEVKASVAYKGRQNV